jgi:bifunctional enzyme CysN/CysC
MEPAPPLTLVVAGHVDHGKSSLLGRLLFELGLLPAGKGEELAAASKRRGVPVEWSFALDGLQAERDQSATLDTTRAHVRTAQREFIVIDAPGQKDLLKNLIGGASAASAALLVLDADAGSEEQTLRHAYLLKLLGVRDVVVAISKMDLVGYEEAIFDAREREVEWALERIGLKPHAIVPVSARDGVNLRDPGSIATWYRGPTLVAALDTLPTGGPQRAQPLRVPVQDVYHFDGERVVAGRIESGQLTVGDTIVFSPSGRSAKVAALLAWPGAAPNAGVAGDNASIVLDRALVVERGDIVSHDDNAPKLTAIFDAEIFWLASTPLVVGRELTLQVATRTVGVRVEALRHRVDIVTLETQPATAIAAAEVARVTLRATELLALDDFAELPATGRFVLRDGFATVGGGIVDARSYPDQRPSIASTRNALPMAHQVRDPERAKRFGHVGAVIWLTGLPASGKSTLAMALERQLFDAGYAVFAIDEDNVRRGLNTNLGLSPEDQHENIRRVGEVAALFAEAGFICVTACLSPSRDDRQRARAAVRTARFFEIYIKADRSTREARDPKGLQRKARQGEVKDATGVDNTYEEPAAPDLIIDTTRGDVAVCVTQLMSFVAGNCRA